MSSSTSSQDSTARAGGHRTGTLVVVALAAALVAGLLGLGVGGVGGALLSTALGGEKGSSTEQNVAEGCAILDRLELELPLHEDSLALDEPLMFELGAAGNHFMAAGAGDTDGELWRAGSDLVAGMSRLDPQLLNDALAQLEPICTDA